MRVTYYKYYLKESGGKKTLYDITKFIETFITNTTFNFKNSVVNEAGEHLYLVNVSPGAYMFIITKNNDLAKLIDTQGNQLHVDDLLKKLKTSENLGFASYVFITKKAFAYSSTISGPKTQIFIDFINKLFRQDSTGIEFIAEPLTRDVSFSDLMKFDRVGKARYKFDSKSSLFKQFAFKTKSVGYLEISVVPKRGEDIRSELKDIEANYGSEIKDLIVSAKENAASELMDYYIFSEGAIADKISKGSDSGIVYQMQQRFNMNSLVQQEIKKIKGSSFIGKEQDIDILCNNIKWPSAYIRV